MIRTAVRRERGPHVICLVSVRNSVGGELFHLTTVQVSIQRTSGSDIMYRESDKAYSFHNWPKTSCMLAIR